MDEYTLTTEDMRDAYLSVRYRMGGAIGGRGGAMNRKEAALVASTAAARKLLSIPLKDRIQANVSISESGCWNWTGYRYSNGYGALSWKGKQRLAHRLSYECHVGPIPIGLQIDHLCRNRGCVNPGHLEPVTGIENTRRAMRTHCVNGHEFTPENTYVPADGKRYCRNCRRTRVRVAQAKRRFALLLEGGVPSGPVVVQDTHTIGVEE